MLIKNTRKLYRESQATFGKRFGVTATAVSLWESGDREAPYKVLEWALEVAKEPQPFIDCDKCDGKGYYGHLKEFNRQTRR